MSIFKTICHKKAHSLIYFDMGDIFMDLKTRPEKFGYYMVLNSSTIRATALFFQVSKSTVHYDLLYKLKKINPYLFCRVRDVIELNLKERHIRGGNKTKEKYLNLRRH